MNTSLPASVRREPSITIRLQKLAESVKQVDTDIPVLRKFLFCLPLRFGLFFCCTLSWFAITSITLQAVLHYNHVLKLAVNWESSSYVQAGGMYVLTLLVSFIETCFNVVLLIGTFKKSPSILTIAYRYYTFKTFMYGILLLVCFITKNVAVSQGWFDRNVDPVRQFLLYDSPQCGLVDILLQMYIGILIRSYVIHLSGESRPVFHIAIPISGPTIPYHALPEFIDPKDMYKY